MKKLSELLKIYNMSEVDDYLKLQTNFTLEESSIKLDDIISRWRFIGDNINNNASIAILEDPNKGIVERITNAIDAVIDRGFIDNHFKNGSTADNVIDKSYPEYSEHLKGVKKGINNKMYPKDASDQVFVVINEGSKSNKPTIDVLDMGTGIKGTDFSKTILSLQNGNKSTEDSTHQIGSFGQGGSTSLGYSYATIIVSKFKDRYYGTVIKSVDIQNQKSLSYVYLVTDNEVSEFIDDLSNNEVETDIHIKSFLSSESGTLVRMIETELDVKYRNSDITKPLSLMDYLDIELFDSPLPIRVIENRPRFKTKGSNQTRYSYGTGKRLLTTKHVKQEFSGTIEIVHRDRPYDIKYYIVLPTEESDWPIDSECKKTFARFNIHEDPLIYVMNGQFIASEKFTRFGNINNMHFLKYRLLVVVDLDRLGKEKYKFVTSNRKSIQKTDLSIGFFDKVLKSLENDVNIQNINNTIAKMTIEKPVNKDIIRNISKTVSDLYQRTITRGNGGITLSSERGRGNKDEEVYSDHINKIEISNSSEVYYYKQQVNIVVNTGANRYVNENSTIDLFINDKNYRDSIITFYNGRIQFSINDLKPGDYVIHAEHYSEVDSLRTDDYSFKVLSETDPSPKREKKIKGPNIKIELVKGKEEIVEINENTSDKSVVVYLCMDHIDLNNSLSSNSSEKIIALKNDLIQPLSLYALLLKDQYKDIDSAEEKNNLIVSLVKTILASSYIK